ncbi:hypothetical protein [Burkholderia cepacia]|nr:hypothetical protein [Burkholderia cepacia]
MSRAAASRIFDTFTSKSLSVAYGLTCRGRREHLDDSELLAYPPR